MPHSPFFRFHHRQKPPQAFTLVEILIVIAIIIVLTVVAISFVNYSSQDASNQATENRLDVLEQQLKTYKLKYGTYPPALENQNTNS